MLVASYALCENRLRLESNYRYLFCLIRGPFYLKTFLNHGLKQQENLSTPFSKLLTAGASDCPSSSLHVSDF
jgi:hypothetical protein